MTKPTAATAPDALTEAELDKLVKNLEEMETEDQQGYAAVVLGQQMGLAAAAITDLRAQIAAMRAATGPWDALTAVIEATGRYSIEICRPDAELAPPKYLTDAWNAAAAQNAGWRKHCLQADMNAADQVARAEKAERENAALQERLTAAERALQQIVTLQVSENGIPTPHRNETWMRELAQKALASAATKGE